MNKRYALGMIVLMTAVALSGCGAKKANDTEGAANGGNNGAANSGNESNATGGSGADETTYLFASDGSYAPMEYMDKDVLKGFDIDFLDAIMKEAGLKYEVRKVGWDAMLESVKQGKEYRRESRASRLPTIGSRRTISPCRTSNPRTSSW